jgi:hypothetical protein
VRTFKTVNVVDFEYEIEDGNLPIVLCMVVYVLDENLRHVDTIHRWRGEFGSAPPFDIGPNALFVAYSAWAEMTCFLRLGWTFPAHIFDLHTAYLHVSNLLRPYDANETYKRPSKGLPDACCSYGIVGWERIEKKQMARDIGEGRWYLYGQPAVYAYCEEDVRMSMLLLRMMLLGHGWNEPADTDFIIYASEYSAKCVARIQARGMPIDVYLWERVQENKFVVIDWLRQQFDPSYNDDDPIYTPDGEWSYTRFERFLIRRGVTAWPRLDSGQLDINRDAFRLMSHIPGMPELSALRDAISVVSRAKLPIGRDGRNRPSLFPFCTATGRNAHSKSLFNAHASMRSFMVFPQDAIGVYCDWRTQEIGVQAAHYGDQKLAKDYLAGDIYYALGDICGLTMGLDIKRWKRECPEIRERMKKLQLAISYGMGVPSLAKGLNRHPLVSSHIIELYRRNYPVLWERREDSVYRAMLDRRIKSYGWQLRLSISPNKRTLYNFPAQAGGCAMLRDATVELCNAGIVPSMLIHDGILCEVKSREEVEVIKAVMRESGRRVCDGLEIDADIDQLLENGARYRDKRPLAKKMWNRVMDALRSVGAIKGEDAA